MEPGLVMPKENCSFSGLTFVIHVFSFFTVSTQFAEFTMCPLSRMSIRITPLLSWKMENSIFPTGDWALSFFPVGESLCHHSTDYCFDSSS
jgi:hypothetical protein